MGRTPSRLPNYGKTEDISNWEETASYVIHKDNSFIIAVDGDTGKEVSKSTTFSTVINYALSNLTNGGTIFIKAGTYETITGSVIDYDNTRIIGEGAATIIKMTNNNNHNLFYADGKDKIEIGHMMLDGNRAVVGDKTGSADASGNGVKMDDCSDLYVHDLFIKNAPAHGAFFFEAGKRSVVRNLTIWDCNWRGIHGHSGTGQYFLFDGLITFSNDFGGIFVSAGEVQDIIMTNCISYDNGLTATDKGAIEISSDASSNGARTFVSNCIFRDTKSDTCLKLMTNAHDVFIDNCEFYKGSTSGDHCVDVYGANDIHFTNCLMISETGEGLLIEGAGNDYIFIDNCNITGDGTTWTLYVSLYVDHVSITNNKVDGGGYGAIYLHGADDYCTITGNHAFNGGVRGGIKINNQDANCTNCLVANNWFDAPSGANLQGTIDATTIIKDNLGWVNEADGASGAIADGATIAHGLSATPTHAVISGTVAGEIVNVTALGAANLTIAIKNNAGAAGTNQVIYWRAWI